MQSTARKNELPLDKMCLTCEVTKRNCGEVQHNQREGAFIHGLFMEVKIEIGPPGSGRGHYTLNYQGARWDMNIGSIAESQLKELYPSMPVMFIKAITQDKQETRNLYECPVYKTRQRGPTYIWTFNLRTKERPAKWVLAGVSLLLQI